MTTLTFSTYKNDDTTVTLHVHDELDRIATVDIRILDGSDYMPGQWYFAGRLERDRTHSYWCDMGNARITSEVYAAAHNLMDCFLAREE